MVGKKIIPVIEKDILFDIEVSIIIEEFATQARLLNNRQICCLTDLFRKFGPSTLHSVEARVPRMVS
jgi:hypothetical protein